jgi:coenzyme PQQ synthesis protein D (PqqD)
MAEQCFSPDTRFCLNEGNVIFEQFDTELVAIQLATGAYHSISGAGIDAFLLLPLEPTITDLSNALALKYEASAARIAEDLERFLEELRNESLLVTRADDGGSVQLPALSQSGTRLPYEPPSFQPYHDLQNLLFIDPVHEVSPAGWPQPKVEPTPHQEARLQAAAGIIFERFDNETVAINPGSGAYYTFSGPTEDLFLLLAEEPTQQEMIQALRGKYAASEQEISDAVVRFLESLLAEGLAEPTPASPESLPARQLPLAKSGRSLPFAGLDLDMGRYRVTSAPVLSAPRDRSRLAFARRRFRLPEKGSAFRAAGHETIVINFSKGEYYLLNASAASVYRLLDQHPTASELVDFLASQYDLSRRDLTASLLLLLNNLIHEGLVTASDAGEEFSRRIQPDGMAKQKRYEPFSVEAFRELRGLFLPFSGARSERNGAVGDARQLISQLADYHRESAERGGLTEAVYHIAGQKVRIRLAGGMQIPELGLAFGHLSQGACPGVPDDFTIQVWDGVSTGPPQSSFLASFLCDFYSSWLSKCGPRGEVLAFHSENLPVLYHAGPDILSIVDTENRTAYYLKRDQSPLPYWEIGSPYRTILHYWFSLCGRQFVHGGAVGTAEGGVILAGRGGSGKSSTTLACLTAGMNYAGDDYCLVEQKSSPYLHSLYSTAKLKGRQDFDRFPDLRDQVWNPECFTDDSGDKATFFLSKAWPHKMTSGFPLRAVLVPNVTGRRDTELRECSEAEALLALSASTLAQLPMAGAQDLQRLGDVVAQLPRYILYLGTDRTQIPAVIRSLL